jgi:hypothetical protein
MARTKISEAFGLNVSSLQIHGALSVRKASVPTAAHKYAGTLTIETNLALTSEKSVKLEGTGREPKN